MDSVFHEYCPIKSVSIALNRNSRRSLGMGSFDIYTLSKDIPMKLQDVVVIQIEKNERVYSFHMPVGAPLGEAYDAGFDALQAILEITQKAAEKARPKIDPIELIAPEA